MKNYEAILITQPDDSRSLDVNASIEQLKRGELSAQQSLLGCKLIQFLDVQLDGQMYTLMSDEDWLANNSDKEFAQGLSVVDDHGVEHKILGHLLIAKTNNDTSEFEESLGMHIGLARYFICCHFKSITFNG